MQRLKRQGFKVKVKPLDLFYVNSIKIYEHVIESLLKCRQSCKSFVTGIIPVNFLTSPNNNPKLYGIVLIIDIYQ